MMHLIPRKESDNLLPVQEQFINQDNVKVSIENHLNELLGIKKEVVKVPPPKEEKEEEQVKKKPGRPPKIK